MNLNVSCFAFLKYFISSAPDINSWQSQPLLQEQHHPLQHTSKYISNTYLKDSSHSQM